MDKSLSKVADPLDDYFSHLLAADGEVEGQHVNWDNLLKEAVSPYHLQEALDSSTLAPGFAPLCLKAPGQGSQADLRMQLLELVGLARTLPAGRLKGMVLEQGHRCLMVGGQYG